jgi:peptidylprolyl isomerase
VATEKRQRQDQRRVEKLKEQEIITTKQQAAKKRNRLLRFLVPGVLVIAAALFWPRGNDDSDVATDSTTTSTVPKVTTTTLPSGIAKKPTIAKSTGAAPTKLTIKDDSLGTGLAVVKGSDVRINKVAKVWGSDTEIDSTWTATGSNPFELTGVGSGVVIAGLDEGLIGMKQGGRRTITIPADKAYGTKGLASLGIKPGDALVYVVDVLAVTPPAKG